MYRVSYGETGVMDFGHIGLTDYGWDCVTLVLLVRGVELTIVLLLGDYG